MRASPPLLVSLDSFRAWRIAVALLSGLAAAALVAWAATAPESRIGGAWLVVLIGATGIAISTRWLWTVPTRPTQLLWDGTSWHVSSGSGQQLETRTGRIDVALDLGPWMLLLFTPDRDAAPTAPGMRVIWLPAERRAAPQEWHALRFTLHGHGLLPPARVDDARPGPTS